MSGAHTAGPWHVFEGDSTTLYVDDVFGAEGGRDYYLVELRHGDEDELAANARLVAAAPRLLLALRECEARLTLLIESQRGAKLLDVVARDEARDAIAEAAKP